MWNYIEVVFFLYFKVQCKIWENHIYLNAT